VSRELQDRWIELADQGLSPWEIRKELGNGSDVRTIQNAINRARAEKAANEIRTKASIQALMEHWQLLVNATSELTKVTRDSFRRLGNRRPVYALGETRLKSAEWSARKEARGVRAGEWTVSLDYEETVEAELLREHTGDNRFWRALRAYSEGLGRFIGARLDLAREASKAVEQAIEISGGDEAEGAPELAGIAVIDEGLLATATGHDDLVKDLLQSISLEENETRLRVRDALLAESTKALPQDLSGAVRNEVERLRGGDVWKAVVSAEAGLRRAGSELDREIIRMKLMPALPGTCGACRRIA
jgi:hypothetical protein